MANTPKITIFQSENSGIDKIIEESKKTDSSIFVSGELSTAYFPPNDYYLDKDFIEQNKKDIEKLKISLPKDKLCIIGSVYYDEDFMGGVFDFDSGNYLFSAAIFFLGGDIVHVCRKSILSKNNYVDEEKYFSTPKQMFSTYKYGNTEILALFATEIELFEKTEYNFSHFSSKDKLIIIYSLEAYFAGENKNREYVVKHLSKKYNAIVLFVNRVGLYEGYIFDGRSQIAKDGEILFKLPAYKEETCRVDIYATQKYKYIEEEYYEEVYNALIFAMSFYAKKLGARKFLIGLSGGIDSALLATLMAHAYGAENVIGVLMPSKFSSEHSITDSLLLAENLGIETITVPIEESFNILHKGIKKSIDNSKLDKEYKDKMNIFSVAEENMQSRLRGIILMTLSNKYNAMLFSTGNRSEASMGYCTLYGDTCGSMLPIVMLYKTEVYNLSRYINKKFASEIIPNNSIIKPPSAELRENQKDQDSLPDYEVLDNILKDYLDNEIPLSEMKQKYDNELVDFVVKKYHANEFKRRQVGMPIYIRNDKRKYPLF